MSGISGVSGQSGLTAPPTDVANKPENAPRISGSGVNGTTNNVPDTTKNDTSSAVVINFLRSLGIDVSSDDASVVTAEANEKLKDAQSTSENDKIAVEQNEKRAKLAEKREKLEESIKKLKEAESGNPIAILKAFFQMLGAYIMAALAAVVSIVPGLQVLGGIMMASAILMAIQALDSFTKAVNPDGMGLMGSLAMAFGADKADAQKADMGFGAALAVAQIALAVAQLAYGRGDAMITAVKDLVNIATALTAIPNAAVEVAGAGVNLANAVTSADGKRAQAGAKQIEALLQMIDEVIDQAIQRLIAAADRFNDVLDSSMDSINDRGNTLAKAKFGA